MPHYLLPFLVAFALLFVTPSEARGGGSSKKKHHRRKKTSKSKTKSKSNAFNHGKKIKDYHDLTPAELLVELSGDDGLDDNSDDFDILLTLLDAAGLTGAVNGDLDDITVFAPNDAAFCRTAKKSPLDYDGGCNDQDVFDFYAALLDTISPGDIVPPLTAILTYHVSGKAMTVKALRKKHSFDTLCEECGDIGVKKARKRGHKRTALIDDGPQYPKIAYKLQNIKVKTGYVHVLKGVLLPELE